MGVTFLPINNLSIDKVHFVPSLYAHVWGLMPHTSPFPQSDFATSGVDILVLSSPWSVVLAPWEERYVEPVDSEVNMADSRSLF